jgi:hypothetical protein
VQAVNSTYLETLKQRSEAIHEYSTEYRVGLRNRKLGTFQKGSGSFELGSGGFRPKNRVAQISRSRTDVETNSGCSMVGRGDVIIGQGCNSSCIHHLQVNVKLS